MINKEYTNPRSFKALCTADFETFTSDTEYFNKNIVYKKDGSIDYSLCKTNIYAYSISTIPVRYDKKDSNWKLLSKKKGRSLLSCSFGYTMEDFMNKIMLKDYRHGTYYKEVICWFHNGHKFDFHFIHAWIQEHSDNWTFYKWEDLHVENKTVDKRLMDFKGKNLYHYEKLGKYIVLDVYIWNEVAQYHVHVDFWDSVLLWKQSVEKISTTYLLTDKDSDIKQWINENFYDALDTLRKVKEIDFNDYQDIDTKYLTLKGGIKVELTTRPSKSCNKVRILYERVVNDSCIMSAFFAYLIVHNVITIPTQPKLYRTAGSLAIGRFAHDYINNHNISQDDRNPDIFWDKYIWEIKKDKKEEVCKLFQPWLTGGYCSYNEQWLRKIVKDKVIFSYDVNSLYPWVCSTYELPYGEPIISDKLVKGRYAFVSFDCDEITQLNKRVPNMVPKKWIKHSDRLTTYKDTYIIRNSNGNLNPVYSNLPQYFTHLKGDIKGFLDQPLFDDVYGNKEWFSIKGLRNVKYYCFKTKFFIKDFMDKYFLTKMNAKTTAEKETAKLNLNSPTGKLGEKIFKQQQFCVGDVLEQDWETLMDDGYLDTSNEYLELFKSNPNKYAQAHITYNTFKMANHAYYPAYQAITFRARYKTIKTALDMATKYSDLWVLYCDTDSIKGFSDGSLFSSDIIDDKKLGYWKQEFIKKDNKVKEFLVLRAKSWAAQWEDNSISLATGGINPSDVLKAITNISDLLTQDSFLTKISKLTKYGVVIINGYKKMSDTW